MRNGYADEEVISQVTDNSYPFLAVDDVPKVREVLLLKNQHFYHFTLDKDIDGIKQEGIHPKFEKKRSAPLGERVEPPAMRYCTKQGWEVGFATVKVRAEEWNEEHPGDPANIVLLRVAATTFLDRPFGLDHSHGFVVSRFENIRESSEYVSVDDFLKITDDYGAISSYAVILPEELEKCDDAIRFCPLLDTPFRPLMA